MQLRNSPERYGAIPKLLHWLTVVLVVLAWSLGTFGDDLPRGATRAAGLSTHIASGLTIIGLLAIRIVWRVVDPPPPPIATPLGTLLISIGKSAHFALYALLAATPAVGVLVQFARGDALPLYGLVEVASPWVRDRAFAGSMKEIHETLANVLIILAVVHAAAAFVHHWIFRDRTLARMLPGIVR